MRPITNGDETDALDVGRTKLTWRPGERKAVKRRANRRERHQASLAIRTGRDQ